MKLEFSQDEKQVILSITDGGIFTFNVEDWSVW
jgi:hypothetical protein